MIRIILKHKNKITTNDLVRFDIRKRGDKFSLYGVDESGQEKGKEIPIDKLEKIILYYKDGYEELISKADIEELLSDITGQEDSICFKYKNKN